jgi:hypothetical protein
MQSLSPWLPNPQDSRQRPGVSVVQHRPDFRRRGKRMRVSRLLLLVFLLGPPLGRADPLRYEFLLLPSANAVGTFDRQAPDTQIHDQEVQADMLLSLQKGPLKLFAEYLLSDHEGDLERMQLGWQLSNETLLWVGRFHQPSSVWNHDHHHGQYLQTSITRPTIDEWEDLGGVIPQHFTGALLESGRSIFGGWKLRTALAGGIAPEITDEGLEPLDVVHPGRQERHAMGYQARASVHPGDLTETGVGLLAAHDRLAVVELTTPQLPGLDHVDITLFGVFATYADPDWKITGTVYSADTRLYYGPHRKDDNFIVGYVQGERHLAHELTVFARWEDSYAASSSPYLQLFRYFARTRRLVGLRWDFIEHQALTVQFANSHTLRGHYDDIRLQWSAAFF